MTKFSQSHAERQQGGARHSTATEERQFAITKGCQLIDGKMHISSDTYPQIEVHLTRPINCNGTQSRAYEVVQPGNEKEKSMLAQTVALLEMINSQGYHLVTGVKPCVTTPSSGIQGGNHDGIISEQHKSPSGGNDETSEQCAKLPSDTVLPPGCENSTEEISAPFWLGMGGYEKQTLEWLDANWSDSPDISIYSKEMTEEELSTLITHFVKRIGLHVVFSLNAYMWLVEQGAAPIQERIQHALRSLIGQAKGKGRTRTRPLEPRDFFGFMMYLDEFIPEGYSLHSINEWLVWSYGLLCDAAGIEIDRNVIKAARRFLKMAKKLSELVHGRGEMGADDGDQQGVHVEVGGAKKNWEREEIEDWAGTAKKLLPEQD